MHERGVAYLLRVPEQRRRNLRIEDRMRKNPYLAQDYLKVLSPRMEKLHDARIGKKLRKHLQVAHRERIHYGHFIVGCKLQQAQLRVVGFLAKEFRIDGQHR